MASSSSGERRNDESDDDDLGTTELLKNWEAHPLVLDEIEESIIQRDANRCLIGEVVAAEIQSAYGLLQILNRVWRFTQALKVEEICHNCYIFTFRSEEEAKEALLAGYWNVRGNPLILHPWKEGNEEDERLFQKFLMWIQVHGLPAKFLSDVNVLKIVERIGQACEVDERDLGEFGSKRFRRVSVLIDRDLPIIPGFTYPITTPPLQIRFRYEKCCNFCIHCGKIGHIVDSCHRLRRRKIEFTYTESIRAESMANQFLCFDRNAMNVPKATRVVAGIRRGMQFEYPSVTGLERSPLMEIEHEAGWKDGTGKERLDPNSMGLDSGLVKLWANSLKQTQLSGVTENRAMHLNRDYQQTLAMQSFHGKETMRLWQKWRGHILPLSSNDSYVVEL